MDAEKGSLFIGTLDLSFGKGQPQSERGDIMETTIKEPAAATGSLKNARKTVAALMPWIVMTVLSVACLVLDDETLESWLSPIRGDDYYFENDMNGRWLAGNALFSNKHKPLLPLDASDYIGFFLAIVGLVIASGGGIGGGGILVPVYIIVMRFTPKHAIALSNVTIFGGACANTYLNTQKRHPRADRPLVDWDLILVMEPLTIGGALGGALLNKVLPEAVLVVLLVLVLSATAYKTLSKGISLYKKETEVIRESMRLEEENGGKDEGIEVTAEGDGLLKGYGTLETLDYKDELVALLEEEKKTPMFNITILIIMFVVVLFINMMKGGGAFHSPLGIVCGSVWFWLANVAMFAWSLAIMLAARHYLVKRFLIKKRIGYKYVEGDIEWDGTATLVYPAICSLAGFFAGMFGIGGGIVKGPLMLAMGVHPEVASATSACMILFTAFTATTSFLVFGLLIYDYAAVCVVIGFVATYFGQVGLTALMKRHGRYSFIVFSIGSVVGLSALLMAIEFFASGGGSIKPSGVCGNGVGGSAK